LQLQYQQYFQAGFQRFKLQLQLQQLFHSVLLHLSIDFLHFHFQQFEYLKHLLHLGFQPQLMILYFNLDFLHFVAHLPEFFMEHH
jgi:hypothetical protein